MPKTRAGAVTAAVLGAAGLLAACGGSSTKIAVPPTTTSTTDQAPATVPAFGNPTNPLPPTAANATENAHGACGSFNQLYIRLGLGSVPSAAATRFLTASMQFATNAATGAPGQWGQMLTDIQTLLTYAQSPAWNANSSQLNSPQVTGVYDDCRPLQ